MEEHDFWHKVNWWLVALGVVALPALGASLWFAPIVSAVPAFILGYVVREVVDYAD